MPPPAPELLGTYQAPRFRYGSTVRCEVRGAVVLVGLSEERANPAEWGRRLLSSVR
jgi:hypothetical protein